MGALTTLLPACLADQEPAQEVTAPFVEELPPGRVAIQVGALDLAEVTSAVYRIEVRNDAGVLVGEATIDSASYGGAQGSASYVMPCDADPDVQPNHVKAELTQLFAGAQPMSVGPLPPQITQDIGCTSNADHPVQFDFSVILSAQQGFFDIKATLEDIFCAAKADVQAPPTAGAAAPVVIGFACGAGSPEEGVDTHLYMSQVVVKCGSREATITPVGGGYVASVADPDDLVSSVKVYRGAESLRSLDALYWNLSFGLTHWAAADDCHLEMQATATDGPLAGVGVEGTPPFQTKGNYPMVNWHVTLSDTDGPVVGSSPVGGDAPFDGVQVLYPQGGWTFPNHYGGP